MENTTELEDIDLDEIDQFLDRQLIIKQRQNLMKLLKLLRRRKMRIILQILFGLQRINFELLLVRARNLK